MIQVSAPQLLGNERAYVLDCLDTGQLSWRGAYVDRFERAFAERCGVRHAIACSSGTAALHLALIGLGIGPGDHVVLPALTYVATANVVRYVGAAPIFCDVDPLTWCLDPAAVEEALRGRSCGRRACVLPVHLYGMPADMTALARLAPRFGAVLVEDAAEAHGATLHGRPVGGLGHVGAFSFYANKLLTTGEGGMLTTNDERLARTARLYRGQGQPPGAQFVHTVVGFNYRLTNLQAALGLAQVEALEVHQRRRALVCELYRQLLRRVEVQIQTTPARAVSANWLFSLLLPHGVDRDTVMARMRHAGVETRPVFPPLTDLPIYARPTPPVTRDIAARGLSLPTHGALTPVDQQHVVHALEHACRT